MRNTPIRFDGDIIITDPCYIIREDSEKDFSTYPKWWDFLSKTTYEIINENGTTSKRYHMPNASDYPDCRDKTIDDYPDNKKCLFRFDKILGKDKHSDIMTSEWDAYNKAIKKWNEENIDDWERCGGGLYMEELGIHTYLSNSTIYGDWSCTTYNSDTKEEIGEFCADAGMVAVFLLEEVLQYNPDFNYHTERPWTTTLIRDFHGTVELHCEDGELTVIGKGNVNFIGGQTGF